ncbi:Na/Pi cotransporter family protein [Roseomonas sp. GC11]|uniref:Na/Pi cotransporter family protein n=1 Tax=Roseomonas sp. GC11 TaxID=2950546 RepID=UPI002109AC0E|nr:Na/Pi cotransporter family protein [Roseomonas sp. GC11]MCQ4162171.1 Na/Pi cotransporter family protein [Roseomonas sp. GC11]
MALFRTLLELAGAVALLIWGVHMVQTGVQRAFGARLRALLGQALRNRAAAFAAGLGVTAILQSSTATGLMVTGFAASGLVELVPALAVMLGANVGTTLIVQLLSFDVAALAPVLILAGVLLFRRSQAALRDFSRVLIGLGLLLMALHHFVTLLEQMGHAPALRAVLALVAAQPLPCLLLGALAAWAAHSSAAIVLLAMSFAAQGLLPAEGAFALVLGANLGTALNPVLEGGAGADPAARRVPLGNLATRLLGAMALLPLLPWLAALPAALDTEPARAVANFHTVFNLGLALLLFPLLPPYARLLERLLPARVDQADPARPRYLNAAAAETPVVALGAAAREVLRLADVLEAMLGGLRGVLEQGDRRRITGLRRMDDILDRLNAAIKAYLTGLDAEAMSQADHQRVMSILAFATHMEQAGDVIDRGLLALVARQHKRGLAFSPEERAELLELVDRLLENLHAAAALFLTEDLRAARRLAAEKEEFRRHEAQAVAAHFQRLRDGRLDAVETSALHLDALRDIKLVNGHLIAAAAYPVLEHAGELLPSRLRPEGE